MSIIELFILGVGLSMDAFAVSICKGLRLRQVRWRHVLLIAGAFGGAQALMPLLGWVLGTQFARYIDTFDHWVAFILLAFIGGKMVWETLHDKDEETAGVDEKLDVKEILVLAVATSIDALAVGISLALVEASIGLAVGIIGVTTFVICTAGVFVGRAFGARYKRRAEICGGVILVLIGLKILLEGLGVLPA